MLLRSSSTPILNSWNPNSTSKDPFSHSPSSHPSPEPEFFHRLPKPKPCKSISASSSRSAPNDPSAKKICRAFSDTNLRDLASIPRRKSFAETVEERDDPEEDECLGLVGKFIFTSSGLGHAAAVVAQDLEVGCATGAAPTNDKGKEVLLASGGCGPCGRGDRCDGGGGGGGGSRGNGGWSSDYGSTHKYYRNMIEANPGDSLLLGNYARFLKEVVGDSAKAEEYCGRAILANPNDANVLSLYADLIWKTHNDSSRADIYYDQAVKAAPHDSYVLASYAHFLWDADEDEETSTSASSTLLHPTPPPLAATS